MRYCTGKSPQRFALLVFLIATGFACSQRAIAGPLPTPLEVNLDLAKSVVIGRITKIAEIADSSQPYVQMGRATIAVSQTLKGSPIGTLEATCAVRVSPQYGGSQVISVYKTGDSGIWIVDADGSLSAYYGLLPGKRKSGVEKMLRRIAARQWSAPVNGLRAWAAVVHPEYHSNPVIIFAVQNISRADIFVPHERTPGFITATATAGEKETHYTLSSAILVGDPMFCRRLSPGEIVYLHPAYSFIDLKWRQQLPVGKYSVVVTCQNTRKNGAISQPRGGSGFVTAWSGKLSAPPIKLILGPQGTK